MQIDTPDQLLARALESPPIAEAASLAGGVAADVYLVGGTIRDLILERPFLDVDLAVDGDAAALATEIGAVSAGETRFGTLSVQRAGYRYDLVRTRSETYSQPGALPDVAPAGIDADLGRRDFTVNALALCLTGSRAGELIGAANALADLEARQLAVLHDQSFSDDPTRLLRLARYASRLGFSIAPHTRELATRAIAGDALATVSGTRIGNELRLLASEQDPVRAFEAAKDLGLPWSLDREMTDKALSALPEDGRADRLVLASVFRSRSREELTAELDRLGFVTADRHAIVEAATRSHDLAGRLSKATSGAEIATAVGASGIETVALASSQGSPSQSLTWLRHLRHLNLEITGDDLIQNGIPEGPRIGDALAKARLAMMDGLATDRDAQLEVALNSSE